MTDNPYADYYLTRVVTDSNYKIEELTDQSVSDALSSIFVAIILLRKYDQHLGNVAFTHGIPISIDNDEIGLADDFPNTLTGLYRFAFRYFYHTTGLTALSLKPRNRTVLVDYVRISEFLNKGLKDNTTRLLGIVTAMHNSFRFGAGFVNAEQLDIEKVRTSILEFKSIKNIQTLAEQSGYAGEDLNRLVNFVKNNQKSLGEDVSLIWEWLTREKFHFNSLDQLELSTLPFLQAA